MSVFLYNTDIIPIIIICTIFKLITSIHRGLFPNMYVSIYDFIYREDTTKTKKSSALRCIYTIILTIISNHYFTLDEKHIYLGLLLACFLIIWPSIVQYNLFSFWKSKEKLICIGYYISFIIFTLAISYSSIHFISPMIFESKEYFLLNNSGVGIIITIISFAFPISFESMLAHFPIIKALDIESYKEDLFILNCQLNIENYISDLYKHEINKICKKNNININILNTIIKLEYIYRGRWYYSLLEKILCKYLPSIAIKKDISVGLTQIKISTAKEILEESPVKFVGKLVTKEFNLEVCGSLLSKTIQDFYDQYEKVPLYTDIYEYIAHHYLVTQYTNINKSVLLYSSILRSHCPIIQYSEDNI